MSTYTSEPGTRLAGRYRLVDQAGAGDGWTFWKATDETLARSVTVLTFASDFPRITEAITAARAASRLNDPRFSQVFDVEDADELAYVVMEWVAGELAAGHARRRPAGWPARGVSGVRGRPGHHGGARRRPAHLRLTPECLHWTRGSGVKITGLGIDQVLTGPDLEMTGPDPTGPDPIDPDPIDPDVTGPQDTDSQEAAGGSPELTDTRDLARLLYAALTGYWPGPGPSAGPADVDGTRRRLRAAPASSPDLAACLPHPKPTGSRARHGRSPRPCRPISTT